MASPLPFKYYSQKPIFNRVVTRHGKGILLGPSRETSRIYWMDAKLKHWHIYKNKNYVECTDTQVIWGFSHPQHNVQRHKTQHSHFIDSAYDHSLKCGFDLTAAGYNSQPWLRQRKLEIPFSINPLTPNDHYSGRTAPLTSRRCILNIYSTNTRTE
jgi:hypothetical protein